MLDEYLSWIFVYTKVLNNKGVRTGKVKS